MEDILQRIRMAQVEAGERVVLDSLRGGPLDDGAGRARRAPGAELVRLTAEVARLEAEVARLNGIIRAQQGGE